MKVRENMLPGRDKIMKKILAAGIIILAAAFAAQAPAQEAGGPKIEVKELKHDFGKVVQGTPVSHVFEVRNAGTEPLVIERVQTS
jgi:uncharacterized protein DUF1573